MAANRRFSRTQIALAGAIALLSLPFATPVAAASARAPHHAVSLSAGALFAAPDGVEWSVLVGDGTAGGSTAVDPSGVEWTHTLSDAGGPTPNGVEWAW
jgi:chitodextrinase